MKEQKNIDRLFQEKFKDFEAMPDDKVWAGIVDKQQKKRAFIPLWLQLSGAAAVLALILLAGNLIFSTSDAQDVEVVLEETETPEQEQRTPKTFKQAPDNAVVSSEEKSTEDSNSQKKAESNPSTKATTVASTSATEANQGKSNASNTTRNRNNSKSNKAGSTAASTGIATADQGNDANATQDDNTSNTEQNTTAIAAIENKSQQNAVADKLPSLEEIANAQNEEEALADTETSNTASQNTSRWGITPMVAPVYYNSFGGSGIAAEFADNKKSGDVNFSYGVQVSYAINDRLTVRSGVNKVDLGYRTEQVNFAPSIQGQSISSIDYNQNSQLIQVADANKSLASSAAEFASNASVAGTSINNALRQELGYIEVPFEAEYALLNRKFGIQVIGGFSTLFLNDNSISLEENNNLVSRIGSSNSLNNTSLSTNVGLGLDYKFTPHIQFNLEPMFKYQLNAYTKSVSDFRPYYLGLYTGLSIRF
ncbi:outer membrane beta-barrel protein [Leeuwenhoekiella sp. ZYFB001]|uniref:outer membrane beta-barrel protein n=1 Tax=Leeuwenhoekiella sp. ZYFB001 TaxID=2719912 RepID=UPI00142FC7EB|nr:outer membrane beta-barrel protein [Leeuwenhoekiella sp. ZYFB001]